MKFPNQNKSKQTKQTKNIMKRSKTTRDLGLVQAPAVIGASPTSLNAHFTWKGQSQKVGGVEQRTATFRQLLSPLQNSSIGAGLFPNAAQQPYSTGSRVPLCPIFVGGNVYRQSQAYRLFKFDDVKIEYIPTIGTSAPAGTDQLKGVAVAYDPNPLSEDGNITAEFANFGELFSGALNLATVAAGPSWAPLVAAAGGLARAAGEKLLRWYQNRKPTSTSGEGLQAMYAELLRSTVLDEYLTELSAHVTALDTATSITGNPTYAVGPVINDDGFTKRVLDQLHIMRGAFQSEINATTQGHFVATADSVLSGSGQYRSIGYFMISGVVTYADPVTSPELENAAGYGDPLDVSNPETAPYHQSLSAGERCKYVTHYEFSSLIPPALQDILVANGYPRIDGPVHKVSTFEKYVMMKSEAARALQRVSRVASSFSMPNPSDVLDSKLRVLTIKGDEIVEKEAPPVKQAEWVQVTSPPPAQVQLGRAAALLQAMREGVASKN